jgi:hypothetical protein
MAPFKKDKRFAMATNTITASHIPPNVPTLEIQSSFTRQEIITALFISTITVLTSLLWGIPFGLIGGASSFILAWMASASAEPIPATVPLPVVPANLVEEFHLDPAQELIPHYAEVPRLAEDPLARHMRNIFNLMSFGESVHRAIYRQSLHYMSSMSLFAFMRDNFHGMDFSRLTLRALKPIRFENGQEGYEMVIQSEEPLGWVHLCINKNQDIEPRRRGNCRFTRIPQVTPFLRRGELVSNHFSTFILPFREREELILAFSTNFPNMDLCQVELQSCRPVSFDFHHAAHHGLDAHNDHYALGFELIFSTPNGIVRYYSDQTGQHIASQNQALNVQLPPA